MKVNREAVEKVKQLIDEGKFRISTPWRDVRPSDAAEDRYIDGHGWTEYGQWYLAVDPDAHEATKERYQFPIGDFKVLHRTGLAAAKQRAAEKHYTDVEEAADELLFLFDRLNTCS